MKNALEHPGLRTKKNILCTECGKTFPDTMKFNDQETDICPLCYAELTIETSRKRKDREIEYFIIVTTRKQWQVIRFFYIEKNCKAGCPARYYIDEVIQQWINKDRFITIAKPRLMSSDMWSHTGNLTIKDYVDSYSVPVNATYPVMRILPEFKKRGFTNAIPQISPFSLLKKLMYDPKTETLLKTKQYGLLKNAVSGYHYKIGNNWDPIKICIRNKYIVKDPSLWFDYIDLLKRYKKDIRNAHYVCPKNLAQAHDHYLDKKRKDDAREEREKKIQRMLEMKEFEKEFIQQKQKFFDLTISDGIICIVTLKNLEEFKQEGELLHHCVFASQYFKKKDSLILSARIEEKPIETIEISLRNLEVIQCRGIQNKNTEYHERIIKLVKNNINQIRQRVAM